MFPLGHTTPLNGIVSAAALFDRCPTASSGGPNVTCATPSHRHWVRDVAPAFPTRLYACRPGAKGVLTAQNDLVMRELLPTASTTTWSGKLSRSVNASR